MTLPRAYYNYTKGQLLGLLESYRAQLEEFDQDSIAARKALVQIEKLFRGTLGHKLNEHLLQQLQTFIHEGLQENPEKVALATLDADDEEIEP